MTPKRTRRLRARTATMNSREDEFEDYGPEPNMKLSHAFMVVLLLHVVAVGGLYAFNSMKHSKNISPKSDPSPVSETATAAEQPESPTEPKRGSGGSPGEEPPSITKAPVVAKKNAPPEPMKTAGERTPKKGTDDAGKGFLASARNMIKKTIGTSAIASASTAVAQDGSPQAATAQTKSALPEATSTPSTPTTYMVKAGDTLTRIAASLNVAIPDLEKVNGMTEKSVIQVGQVLKVPVKAVSQAANELSSQAGKVAGTLQQVPGAVAGAVGTAATAVAGGSSNAAVASPGDQGAVTEYTIVKGDSPYKIARKFKITPDQLMKANGITDPKKIQIGQKLKIPVSTSGKKSTQ